MRKTKTAAGVLWAVLMGAMTGQAALFSQNFSRSNMVGDYVDETTPSANQFTVINGGATSIEAGQLKVVNAAGTAGNVRRWVAIEGTPVEAVSFSYKMGLTVAAGYAANTRLITGSIGEPEPGKNWMAWGIDATGLENEWKVAGNNEAKFTGPQTVTIFMNASAAPLHYTDPAAGKQVLAPNSYDLWVGTTQVADGKTDAFVKPEYDLTTFTISLALPPAVTYYFDNFEVLELSANPTRALYEDDFSGPAGVATNTVPDISPKGFEQRYFFTGLDGKGRLESTNPDQATAGYRVKLGPAPLTADSTIAQIKYTATLRIPTNDWVMIGFQEADINGLLFTDANNGPVVQFSPTFVLLRGGTWGGGNTTEALAGYYSPGDVITAEMTYHVAEQAMDLSIDGSTVTNRWPLNHEFPVGTSSAPVVYWLNTHLRYQPSAANGGAYIDHLQVETLP